MGTPYFNRDESIVLTAHEVKFESILSDVMLTNQRLILIDSGYAQFSPQTISLSTIETVIGGEDAYGNPIITLSLAATTPGGATQPKELVFSQKTRGERKQECDDWVKRLKEQITLVRQKESIPKIPADEDTDIIFDDTITGEAIPVSDDMTPPKTTPAPQRPVIISPQEEPTVATDNNQPQPAFPTPVAGSVTEPKPVSPKKPNFSTIAAIIIVILAIAGGVFIYSDNLQGTPQDPLTTVTTVPATTAVTTAVTPVLTTITPEQTPAPAVTMKPTPLPTLIIPETGVWVRVRYSGNFAGDVGTAGGMRHVSGTGEHIYQIPTVDGPVDVTIDKQDGSGDVLSVEVYKDGTLVKRDTNSAPRGVVDMSVDLKGV
jgi:hypothetical protein